MSRLKISFPLLFLFLFLQSLIPSAHGVGNATLNLTKIPEGIGYQLGIGTDAGGLLASAILISVVIIPLAMYEKRGIWLKLIIGLILMGFCVVIEWLPIYFMIIPALFVALSLSSTARKWISG